MKKQYPAPYPRVLKIRLKTGGSTIWAFEAVREVFELTGFSHLFNIE